MKQKSAQIAYPEILYNAKFGNLINLFVDFDEKMNLMRNAYKLGCSMTFLYKAVRVGEHLRLLETVKEGREILVKFTASGCQVRENLRNVRNIIEESASCKSKA